MLLQIVEDDGIRFPLLVILAGVLFEFVGIVPFLIKLRTRELKRTVLYLYLSLLARYKRKAYASRADGAVGEYGGQVSYQRFVNMSLERGTLVGDGNLVNEFALCLVIVEDMNKVSIPCVTLTLMLKLFS